MRIRTLVIVVVAIVAVLGILGYLATNQAVGKHLGQRLTEHPEDYGLQAERVSLSSRDGVGLVAWWFPAQGRARGTVLLVHGVGGNRSEMLSRAAFLVRDNSNVLDLDLRCHGESGGNYYTPGYMEAQDILGGVSYLRQHGVEGPIVAMGHSYGAVAALHAGAQSSEIAAVIADSPFISYADMMARYAAIASKEKDVPLWARLGLGLARYRLLQFASRAMFYFRTGVDLDARKADAYSAIPRITQPVLFIAGERDPIAPPENARQMYEAARSPQKALVIISGADHNTTYRQDPRAYETAVLAFLNKAFPQP